MTARRNLLALLASLALAAACASTRSSRLPREPIPSTFAPLRWSVGAEEAPALFPDRVARPGAWSERERHVTWTVPDARRVEGVPGTLVADWIEGGALTQARLSFEDPRRTCDPEVSSRPRPCAEPGPVLSRVYDVLYAELARGRGSPEDGKRGKGARSATWSGMDLRLELAMEPDEGGAWWVEAKVVRALAPGR